MIKIKGIKLFFTFKKIEINEKELQTNFLKNFILEKFSIENFKDNYKILKLFIPENKLFLEFNINYLDSKKIKAISKTIDDTYVFQIYLKNKLFNKKQIYLKIYMWQKVSWWSWGNFNKFYLFKKTILDMILK